GSVKFPVTTGFLDFHLLHAAIHTHQNQQHDGAFMTLADGPGRISWLVTLPIADIRAGGHVHRWCRRCRWCWWRCLDSHGRFLFHDWRRCRGWRSRRRLHLLDHLRWWRLFGRLRWWWWWWWWRRWRWNELHA